MFKKCKKRDKKKLYIPLEEIETINSAFLDEMERVKKRLAVVCDKDIIKAFQNVLLDAYGVAIEVKANECAVDYDIKYAEIDERRRNLSPWRRCKLWRLLLRPLTNRAQDIIEERTELEADIIHTEAEKAIDSRRELIELEDRKPEREIRREVNDKLKEIIKAADNADTSEAIAEPAEPGSIKVVESPACEGQLQGQLSMDLNSNVSTRKPRPPRSCRK